MLRRFSISSAAVLTPVSLALLATSCGIFQPAPPPKAKLVLYEWRDDGGPGELNVEIDLAKQIALYKRSNRLIGWSFVSSGKEGHATSAGDYTITEKLPVKLSNKYGWMADAEGKVTSHDANPATPVPPGDHYCAAPMHEWMRITSYGVGLHAGEILRPGEAASHGCIRLPYDFAPILYQVTKVGTPVKVTRGTPRKKAAGVTGSLG